MNTTRKMTRMISLALILALCTVILPAQTFAESFQAEVTASKMIVRAGASASSQLLGYLPKGTVVNVLSYADGIAYIEYRGNRGYALVSNMKRLNASSSATSAPEQGASLSGLGTVTANSLPVYASASTSAKLLGTLRKGATVTVLATKNGWAQLQNGSAIGYALLNGLFVNTHASATPAPTASPSPSPTPESAAVNGPEAEVIVSKMSVYRTASTASTKLGTLSKGVKVTVIEYNNTWARIYLNGNIGYAKCTDMRLTGNYHGTRPAETPTVEPTISPVYGAEAVVTASWTNLYQFETDSSRALATLYEGNMVTVIESNGTWAKVLFSHTIGYMKCSVLRLTGKYTGVSPTPSPTTTPTPSPTSASLYANGPEAEVTVSRMYVYKKASVSSSSLGSLPKGTKVTVLDYDNSWARIYLNGNIGYAKCSNMRLTGNYHGEAPEATPTPTPVPTPDIQQVMNVPAYTVKKTAVYDNTLDGANALKTVNHGDEISVLGIANGWALVSAGSVKGYMPAGDFVKKSDVTMEITMSAPAVISQDNLAIYKFASEKAPVYGTCAKNTEVTLLAYNGEWAMLTRQNVIAYASVKGITVLGSNDTPTLKETVSTPAIINHSGTKCYAYATETANVVQTASAGDEVTLLGYDDTWCLISRAGSKVYVLRNTVTLVSSIVLSAGKDSYPGIVTASKVDVYQYATNVSQRVGALTKGNTFTVLAQGNGWALIKLGDNIGYVPLSGIYVQMDEFISPTIKSLTATVIKSGVSLYSCALEKNEFKTGDIGIASPVAITAYTDKWARVLVNGSEQYVLMSALSANEYTPLASGKSSGNLVLTLQKALEDLGYFDGLPAGNYGSLTTSAVQRFQKQLGVEATGAADINTLRVLYAGFAPESPIHSASLKLNNTGNDVLRLQTRLAYKGYMNSTLDGEYGPITEKAVKLYQKAAGLSETGAADAQTLKSLFSTAAPNNPSAAVTGGSASTGGSVGTGSTGSYSTNPSDDPASGTGSSKVETVIEWALAQLGKKYVYGKQGPDTFDCSGFTQYCFAKVGVSLRRSAQAVGYNDGTKITEMSDLKRGDLVCFNTIDDNDLSDHVGIYLGSNKFIHASSGAGKVVISSLNSGYYKRVFSWGRRVL